MTTTKTKKAPKKAVSIDACLESRRRAMKDEKGVGDGRHETERNGPTGSTIDKSHYTTGGEHPEDRIYRDREYIHRTRLHLSEVYEALEKDLCVKPDENWLFDFVHNEDRNIEFEDYLGEFGMRYKDIVSRKGGVGKAKTGNKAPEPSEEHCVQRRDGGMRVLQSQITSNATPPPIREYRGYVNCVLAMRADTQYDTTNTYLPKWEVVNAVYYNAHLDAFDGWIDLDDSLPPEDIL